MNADKDLRSFFADEPPGQKTNAGRWLQKKIMRRSLELPREFDSRPQWEAFRDTLRKDLPATIGLPEFPPLGDSCVRARIHVGEGCICERIDIHVDEDYAIPAFLLLPDPPADSPAAGLVWSGGFTDTKWKPSHQKFALRMARKGFAVCLFDHAPFGETSAYGGFWWVEDYVQRNMTLIMSMGHLLGISARQG